MTLVLPKKELYKPAIVILRINDSLLQHIKYVLEVRPVMRSVRLAYTEELLHFADTLSKVVQVFIDVRLNPLGELSFVSC